MAEAFNPPIAEPHQGEDNEQRIDGDGQEVNALRFLGAGGPAPAPPPPAITPVSSGVSQPLQSSQQQPPPSQTPHPPSQPSQQPQQAPVGFDYSDPTSYASMQMPNVPMSGPYGMPPQVPGMMGGAPPMMMMPPYNYMYPSYFMPGPYASIPSAAPQNPNQAQLHALLNHLRVKEPKFYREWYKKYEAHRRNPDRIPFPPLPGFSGLGSSSQTLPYRSGRSRKESTRSSVNGDSYRHLPNEPFDYSHVPGGGAYGSMNMSASHHDHRRQPSHSGRASVNGDYRHHQTDDEFGIEGADMSSLSMIGGNGILTSTQYPHPSDRDRPPTQSGRSSTVGEPYRLQPEDIYGGGYAEQHQQQDSLGYDNRFQPITEHVREPSPKRMTPLKFNTFHFMATITPLGHIMKTKNSGTGLEFLKLKQFVSHLPEYKEMESFPGPLTIDSTHKNTVIQYCRRKIKEADVNTAQLDKNNYIFLWEFLILMLRQNGMVVGSDVADLLLEAAEKEQNAAAARVEEVRDVVEGGEDNDEIGAEDTVPPVVDVPAAVKPRDEDKLVKEFCEHLLHGHKKDALDFAMDNDLWGHALFFASKMDERSYGHVLARFANGIPLNSPLQTLYHIMSGKQPASVTSCADESFGDWKPHLAMLLSNSGYKPDVEHKAILTLGDTLISRNHIFAAQFCYLMGHEQFHVDSRLGSLLGFSIAGNNVLEASQMTEVYEFARKLADPGFTLGTSFLQSKLDYSKSLISLGFVQEALAYCEEIAKTLKTRKIEEAELKVVTNTLQIAEKIAAADESGSASTWIEDLRRMSLDPMIFSADALRKLSLVSSNQEQGSEHLSVGSQYQNNQASIPPHPQDIYDPYGNQNLPQDNHNSPSQYDTAALASSASANTSDPNDTCSGIADLPHENNTSNQWNNQGMMNGGLHISGGGQMYDVNQQQLQQPQQQNSLQMNPITPGNYGGGGTGPQMYQPMPSMPSTGYQQQPYPGSSDKLGNVAAPTDNNNYWSNPYDSQSQHVPSNDSPLQYKDQGHSNSAKKKSVRFEDEHGEHADVECVVGNGQSVVRARHVNSRQREMKSAELVELKSAMKSGGLITVESNLNGGEQIDSQGLAEVEYKSTYPIDEPIEHTVGSRGSGLRANLTLPIPLSEVGQRRPWKSSKTFPIDRECCDVNEPCEEHDEFGGESSGEEDGVHNGHGHLPSQFPYEDKTDSVPKKPASEKGEKKKKAALDGGDQKKGWFPSIFGKLIPNQKNQMHLPDDKNPTIVWDPKEKRWMNTAADGEDDLAPAGPPPKDSDLMGGGKPNMMMPNGAMSLPPMGGQNQSVPPPSAYHQPNMNQQQQQPMPNNAPVASFDGSMGQYQQNQGGQMQNMQNQMMMNASQQMPQQQQQQHPQNPNNGMMSPGMAPPAMNKYKLQKGRSLKNSYVDVLNPNGTRSDGGPAAPQLPMNMPGGGGPQLAQPTFFVPPVPSGQSQDGPVSFLTPPQEDGPAGDADGSHPQAPPMFNPAQFQQQGYPQGQ